MSRELPVIDLEPFRLGDGAARQAVAHQIADACTEVGFFFVTGHGVPVELVAETFAQSARFFDLPLDQKLGLSIARSPVSRGYEPIGAQRLDENAAVDQKESFYIGVERYADDPLVGAGTPNHGPNQWPVGLDGFRSTMEAYFAAMTQLAAEVASGLAVSLNVDADYFAPFTDNPMNILRLLRYPPEGEAAAGAPGAGTHTDWGCLTILAQQDTPGLEVRDLDDRWTEATPVEGAFVVNIGDMMARWSNDRYRSTPHRVFNRSGRIRHSIAFFNDINYHAVVECLPGCSDAENPPKYPPILAGEHIAEMYRRTYGTGQ